MKKRLLENVQQEMDKYKTSHHGEQPLYILVSPHEVDELLEEIRQANGYDADTLVTTFGDSKIVKYDALNKGELLLTNELPETSS